MSWTYTPQQAAAAQAAAAQEAARVAALSAADRATVDRVKAAKAAVAKAGSDREQAAYERTAAQRAAIRNGQPAPRGDWAQPATGAELAAINARIAAAQLRGSQPPRNSAGQIVGAYQYPSGPPAPTSTYRPPAANTNYYPTGRGQDYLNQQSGTPAPTSTTSPTYRTPANPDPNMMYAQGMPSRSDTAMSGTAAQQAAKAAAFAAANPTYANPNYTTSRPMSNSNAPFLSGTAYTGPQYGPPASSSGTPWSTIPFVGNPVRTPYQTAPTYTPPATSNPNNYRPPNNVAGYTGPGYTPAQQQAPIYNPAGPPGADNPAQYRDPLYDSNGNWITGKPAQNTPPVTPQPTGPTYQGNHLAGTFPQGDWRNDPNLRIDTKQNTPAPSTGQPPNIQTRDIVNLPGGGQGSQLSNPNNLPDMPGYDPSRPSKRPDWLSKDHGFNERTGGIVYGFPQHPLGDKRPTPTNTNNYNNYNQPIDPKPPRWTPQAPLYIPGGPPAQNTPAPSQPGQTYDSNYWNAKYNPQGPPPAPPTWGTPNTPSPFRPIGPYTQPAPTNNGSTRPIYNDPNTPRPYNPLDQYRTPDFYIHPGNRANPNNQPATPAPINTFPPLGRPEQNTTNTPGIADAYNARNGINSQPPAPISTPAPYIPPGSIGYDPSRPYIPPAQNQPAPITPTPITPAPITPAPITPGNNYPQPSYVTPVPGSAFGTNFTGGIPEIGAAADRERQESARRNAERSNSIISGYDQQIGNSQRMSDADYQQSQNDYAGITADANATRARNMGRIDQYGQAARSDLNIKNKQALAAASQSAISRGLGNTTIRDSLQRGQNFDNSRQMMNLEDQLLQNRISTDSNLSNSYQNTLQTRAQFLQNQRAQKLANEQALRGRQLQFIEGINDEGPSFNDVSNYYMQAAALRG